MVSLALWGIETVLRRPVLSGTMPDLYLGHIICL